MSTMLSSAYESVLFFFQDIDTEVPFKSLADFFGGSADLGKGLVYMAERVMETLNIK